jgi:type II secretory pathway pseudopilin PulG
MTLLEALLATVILSLVAIACLEGTSGAAALQHRAGATAVSVARADAALAEAAAGAPPSSPDVRVSRRAYVQDGRSTGLEVVDVEVPTGTGAVVHLSRLVARATSVPTGGRP